MQHVFEHIRFGNTEALEPVFDSNKPIRSTGDMVPWYTGKPVARAEKSHINCCVADSTWEANAAMQLDRHQGVVAWVKNDHLGFEVAYMFDGMLHKYRPDYLIRLMTGATVIVEVKGMDTERDRTKRRYVAEWVEAVNGHGGFGRWDSGVALSPSSLPVVIARAVHGSEAPFDTKGTSTTEVARGKA